MPFCKLVGNDLAKAALQRMAEQNSVPSTLLFYGPDGIGKSLFALGLAELLMGKSHAPKLASFNHPDLHIYRPEGKSATHPIENVRKLIDEAALPPFEAPVKVFVIHDAHQMLPYSSNALLKTLEEPSFHSYFILLTSALDAMLPTIVSRSRKVPFFPIPQLQMEALVKEKWQKTPEEARRIAFLAHGSVAKAQQLAENAHTQWRTQLLDILTLNLPAEYPQLLTAALELEQLCAVENGEDEEESAAVNTDALLEEIVAWYRDLQLLKEGIAPEFLYHLDSMDRLQLALHRPIPPLEKVLEQIAKARLALQRSVKLRSVLENFLFGVCC